MQSSAVAVVGHQGGSISFADVDDDDAVRITVHGVVQHDDLRDDCLHGFHIHEFGDTTDGCASMGSHYNPTGHTHGGPTTPGPRHAGDLGNLATDATGRVCESTSRVVHGLRVRDLVGRGVVIHARRDDQGRGPQPESSRTGNAGARVLCAPIAYASSV